MVCFSLTDSHFFHTVAGSITMGVVSYVSVYSREASSTPGTLFLRPRLLAPKIRYIISIESNVGIVLHLQFRC